MKTRWSVFRSALLLAVLALLSGCVTVYKPIPLDASFWQDRQPVIGVAAEALPEAGMVMLGQQGLLDVAINKGNAAPIVDQMKKLDVRRAAAISDNLAKGLSGRGFKVSNLATLDVKAFPEFKPSANAEQYSPRDFTSLKSKGIDRLLLVTVVNLGAARNYYGFVPTSPPRAMFTVKGWLIDLKDNKLLWYNTHQSTAAIADPWDQAPDFPNLSDAVLKNVSEGSVLFERSFFTTK
jgi:hypothetical protein